MLADTLTVAGRTFTPEEIKLVRQLVINYPGLSRHELAATACELLQWQRPNGRLKTRECRDLLEALAGAKALALPAKRAAGRPKGPSKPVAAAPTEPMPPVLVAPLRALAPVQLVLADTSARRRQARELLQRYHYLGHRTPFGAHLLYLAQTREPLPQTLGVLQYSSPAWRMRERDRWIGWDEATRCRELQRVVNQSRFLILPWLRIRNLASHVLALSARQLCDDWYRHYRVRPVLLETLVDEQRYAGTCYRAANWIALGSTSGRGRMDRTHQRHHSAPKRLFVYPLVDNARALLASCTATQTLTP